MSAAAEFLGRLHPIALHAPLTLLVAGGAIECVRVFRDTSFLAATSRWLFVWGAATALLAAGTGWLLAAHEPVRADHRLTLEWHRWLGIGSAAAAVLVCVTNGRVAGATHAPRTRLCLSLAAAILVVATGHFGGTLIWGRDWF